MIIAKLSKRLTLDDNYALSLLPHTHIQSMLGLSCHCLLIVDRLLCGCTQGEDSLFPCVLPSSLHLLFSSLPPPPSTPSPSPSAFPSSIPLPPPPPPSSPLQLMTIFLAPPPPPPPPHAHPHITNVLKKNTQCLWSLSWREIQRYVVTHWSVFPTSSHGGSFLLKVTGSPRGGRGQTICSSPFFSHRKYASEIKLSRHKAGMVDNMQTNHHYSSSHCSRCMLVKSVPANYSPKISSAKTASKSILLLGDTP